MSFLSRLLKKDPEPPKKAEPKAAAAPTPSVKAPAPPSKPAAPAASAPPSAPDLDRIRKELMEIAAIVGEGSETASNAPPDSMVELRFADIAKIAPQAFTSMENLSQIADLQLCVVVPNLYDQLAKGKVTTSLRNLTADVPSEHVSQYTLDHGDDLVTLPLPMVISAVQPTEFKKRTATKEKDLGQYKLPNLFTASSVKAAAASAPAEAAAPAKAEPKAEPKPAPAPEAPKPEPAVQKAPEPVVQKAPPPPAPEPVAKVEPPAPEPVTEPEPAASHAAPPAPEPEPVSAAPEPEPVVEEAVEPEPALPPEEEEQLVAQAEAISRQEAKQTAPVAERAAPPVEEIEEALTPPEAPAPAKTGPAPVVVKVDEDGEPVLPGHEAVPGAVMLNGINVNIATVDELVSRLDSVGRKLAEKIVQERTIGGNFKNIGDLSRVAGIRGKKFEKITGLAWRSEMHRHRELIDQLISSPEGQIPDIKGVAARFREQKSYVGCIIIHEDGFVLASNWENESRDALGAFAPQMFKKIGRYVNHLKLGSIRCLTFFTEEQPITIVRSGKIFFAAMHAPNNFGRKQVEVVQALTEELGGRLTG